MATQARFFSLLGKKSIFRICHSKKIVNELNNFFMKFRECFMSACLRFSSLRHRSFFTIPIILFGEIIYWFFLDCVFYFILCALISLLSGRLLAILSIAMDVAILMSSSHIYIANTHTQNASIQSMQTCTNIFIFIMSHIKDKAWTGTILATDWNKDNDNRTLVHTNSSHTRPQQSYIYKQTK